MNKLRRIFKPTKEEIEEDANKLLKLFDSLGNCCVTCKHCKHVIDYPGFVTGEECICTVGLKCDTVLGTVKDCKSWESGREELLHCPENTVFEYVFFKCD